MRPPPNSTHACDHCLVLWTGSAYCWRCRQPGRVIGFFAFAREHVGRRPTDGETVTA